MFHKVVWRHRQGVVWFLITTLLQIYQGILQWTKLENRLRLDRIIAMSLWRRFFTPPCRYASYAGKVDCSLTIWHRPHSMRNSVCASIGRLSAARIYRSIAVRRAGGQQQPRRSTARSSKCGQCHVVSWRRKVNTDWLIIRLSVVTELMNANWAVFTLASSAARHTSRPKSPMT